MPAASLWASVGVGDVHDAHDHQSPYTPFPCWEACTSRLAAAYETLLAFLHIASAKQRQACRQEHALALCGHALQHAE
jgi:hypothetical protein